MKILILFLVTILSALSAEDKVLEIDVPPTPDNGIYDPDQWLTNDAQSDIIRNISIAKLKWQAEVFVIILGTNPDTEKALLAKTMAEEWGDGKLWGVVMHIVGEPESPLFFLGREDSFGWNEKQEENFTQSLEKALSVVKSRAFREEDLRLQVQSGTREMCDELGYLGLVMSRLDKRYDRARGDNLQIIKKQRNDRNFLKKLVMVLVPLFLLICVMLVFSIRKKRRESKSNFFFPETSPRRRFLGPWSGGADVIVSVGSRLREDGSRKG